MLGRLIGWAGQKAMKSEARRIAKWAAEKYPVVKAQNPDLSEEDVLELMVPFDTSRMPPESQRHYKACCVSIEGVCYMIAMDPKDAPMKGALNIRCLQFFKYLEDELRQKGFRPQTRETRIALFKEWRFPIEEWDALVAGPQNAATVHINETDWYYTSPEGPKGPLTKDQLRRAYEEGQLDAETPVWRKGDAKYKRAKNAFPDVAP